MSKKFAEYNLLDLPAINREVLERWEAEDIFRKSLEIRKGAPSFIFYEGPPSANGMPGIHHVIARSIKDIFCRYKTMKGFLVNRKAGWDTHGLPVELGVEKSLGITKEDIGKKISVEEYNAACRKDVMKYTKEWEDLTRQMGYWVDMEHPYITYDNKYIETLWYLLKQLYDKCLLYKGYTIQPYSPAAGTGLSSHELNQPGCYRDVKDLTAIAMFKLKSPLNPPSRGKQSPPEGDLGGLGCYFLAWTTTPWTLPSNTALCVGANIDYVKIKTQNPYSKEEVYLILAEVLVPSVLGKNEYEILEKYKGKDLEGLEYEQLIPFVKPIDTNIAVENKETASDIWKQITNEIKRISPDIHKTINQPAEISQIKELESVLDCTLPQSFVDFLLVFNGQSEKGNEFPLFDFTRFLPVNEIIETIEQQIELFGDEEPLDHIKENKIKPVLWNKRWLPFAEFNGNTRLILDLDAGKNGKNGQIIMLWSGIDMESDEVLLANSFEEFGNVFLNHLKNNDFKMENGIISFSFPAPADLQSVPETKAKYAEMAVNIVEIVDEESFPSVVKCEMTDIYGKKHTFIEKVPIVSSENILPNSKFPMQGTIRGKIVSQNNEKVVFNIENPDFVNSIEGKTEFEVNHSQIISAAPQSVPETAENSATINQFLSKLISQNWQINKMPVDKNNVAINKNAFERIQKAPKEFVDFISSFSELENDEKNVWFLSYKDFVDDEKNAFAWNEFENQSIEAADNDKALLSEIKEYWNNHIPFLMSVKDGYSYVSICISKENYGKIYSGYEPEYEVSECIAENLSDFLTNYPAAAPQSSPATDTHGLQTCANLQNLEYNECKKKMSDYESNFENDSLSSLKNMIDLYGDLKHTSFHDITDAVELWIDAYPDKRLSEYIKGKNDNYCNTLADIINAKNAVLQSSPQTAENQPNAFRVICGDFVTTEDGTGIVHMAPTFGADDDRVAKQNGIAPMLLLDKNGKRVPMVDLTGKFYTIENLDADFVQTNANVELYKNYAGKFVKDAYYAEIPEHHLSLDTEICLWLQEKSLLFKKEKHTHNYPHCWRTDKPVLYYPLDSWFIRTTAVKDEMIALNNTINWKPQSTGTGRFGKWLENLNDWNLSRSRYWGTPLPIWRTEDGSEEICIGSLEELFAEIDKSVAAGFMQENPYPHFKVGDYSTENYDVKNIDLHRPYVDNIVLVSQSGKPMKRELDLIDVWFDSGAMPFAQVHWPFENSEKIK